VAAGRRVWIGHPLGPGTGAHRIAPTSTPHRQQLPRAGRRPPRAAHAHGRHLATSQPASRRVWLRQPPPSHYWMSSASDRSRRRHGPRGNSRRGTPPGPRSPAATTPRQADADHDLNQAQPPVHHRLTKWSGGSFRDLQIRSSAPTLYLTSAAAWCR